MTQPSNTERPSTGVCKGRVSYTHALALLATLVACLVPASAGLGAERASLARYEVENFGRPAGAFVVSDSKASGGKALKFTASATATKSVTTTGAADTVIVVARGRLEGGKYPELEIKLDNADLTGTGVRMRSNTYERYAVTRSVSAGTHTLGIRAEDVTSTRPLYVDAYLLKGASNEPPAPPPTDHPGKRAKQAGAFVNSIGVNTHWAYHGVYRDRYAGLKTKVRQLGVKHMREHAYHTTNTAALGTQTMDSVQYPHLRELNREHGIKFSLIIDPRWTGFGYPLTGTDMANVYAKAGEAVSQFEGPNEPDLNLGSDWASESRRYQQNLYAAVKGNQSTAHVPVLAPSVAHSPNAPAMGDLSTWIDYGNMHSYPGGKMPTNALDDWNISNIRKVSGTKPIQSTETGYHNASGVSSGHIPASEWAAGRYAGRLFFEYFNRGIPRTYYYELVDEFAASSTNMEANFGLLRRDLSEKPAWKVLENTIDILQDPGRSFAPGRLDYRLSGETGNVNTTLLQKRGGRFFLVLWQEDSSFGTNKKVTLNLGAAPARVKTFLPLTNGTTPTSSQGGSKRVLLSVPDHPIIVKIRP